MYRGAGTWRSGGHMTAPPPEIYLGVKHGILTPRFFGKKYFLVHVLIQAISQTIWLCFCYHFQRICGLLEFRNVAHVILTPKSKNSSRAPGHVYVNLVGVILSSTVLCATAYTETRVMESEAYRWMDSQTDRLACWFVDASRADESEWSAQRTASWGNACAQSSYPRSRRNPAHAKKHCQLPLTTWHPISISYTSYLHYPVYDDVTLLTLRARLKAALFNT